MFPLFSCYFVKKTWLPGLRLHQKEPILESAQVEITVVTYLGQEEIIFTKKLPAYSKPPSVEARCLAY